MKTGKLLITVLIGSLFILNASYARSLSPNPKSKLCTEITLLLDNAYSLDLKGETVETTIVVLVRDDHKLMVIDSGTGNSQLDQFIREKLNNKKVWTRNVETNFHYLLKVRFEPGK